MAAKPTRGDLVEIARQILHRKVTPIAGAAGIWQAIAECNYEGFEDLRVWAGLAGEWQDSPEDRVALNELIVAEAKRLVENWDSQS